MGKKFALLIICLLLLNGCGQWNIFKWAHKEGGASGSDTTVLVADGQALLDAGDQASLDKAVEVFQKAVDANPRSSEANYGLARSVIAASGLGLADLITSVIQQAGGSAGSLPMGNPFISFVSAQSGNLAGANLFDPTKINLTTLYAVSKKAITPLKNIADGKTDGVIPADDFDVNFNLAFCLTIHSVCSLLDWDGNNIPGGTGDIINVTGDFKITIGASESTNLSDVQNYRINYSSSQVTGIKTRVFTSLNEVLDPTLQSSLGGPFTPTDYNDSRGAIHYLIIALGQISPDAANELKGNVNQLATDPNSGIKKLKDEINNW